MFGIMVSQYFGVIFLDRVILHCDLNNFYASVECVKNPSLQGKSVAVCGNEDDRHGIILAKSQKAKSFGVQTGDTVIEAKRKCKDLIVVQTDFEAYHKFSVKVKEIYKRYTDLIESFGMDECWLDVSGSTKIFGNGEKIADEIRNKIKEELGLTISVGVSFNKIFAKLGSDMKKPDATTVISKENFREKIWGLPASDLFYVGRKTTKALQKYGIYTIGDIAVTDVSLMRQILGKNGVDLWIYANGMDKSPVSHINSKITVQSVSRGITCMESLVTTEEAERVISELSSCVSKSLRQEHLLASGVQLAIKNDSLSVSQYSSPLQMPTHNVKEIYNLAVELLKKHKWEDKIRSVSVRTYNLIDEKALRQFTTDVDMEKCKKCEKIDEALIDIRNRFGKNTVFNSSRLLGTKMPADKSEYSSLPPASVNF